MPPASDDRICWEVDLSVPSRVPHNLHNLHNIHDRHTATNTTLFLFTSLLLMHLVEFVFAISYETRYIPIAGRVAEGGALSFLLPIVRT